VSRRNCGEEKLILFDNFFHKFSGFLNKMSGMCTYLNLYVQKFKMFLDIHVHMFPGGKTKQSLERFVFCGMTQCTRLV